MHHRAPLHRRQASPSAAPPDRSRRRRAMARLGPFVRRLLKTLEVGLSGVDPNRTLPSYHVLGLSETRSEIYPTRKDGQPGRVDWIRLPEPGFVNLLDQLPFFMSIVFQSNKCKFHFR